MNGLKCVSPYSRWLFLMSFIVGIDLGTTNSLCAIFRDGHPILIPNAHGSFLTPSVVGILDDGRILVGQSAKELRVTRPERCISRFKRAMGTNEKLSVAGKSFSAPELSSLVLKSLKQDAEAFLAISIEEAVITVPAYFNDHQRRATKLAGEMAGLNVRRIINEPTAAALTYGFHDRDSGKHLLVVDLGGGTFDVTLMEIFEGTLEIVATSGESMLGGEDFTDRLVAAVLKKVDLQLEVAEMKHPLLVSRLRQSCETAKLALATDSDTSVSVPTLQGLVDETSKRISISRDSFAAISKPLLDRLLGPIHKAMRDAEIGPKDIDDIILVGGATRMPCLQEFLTSQLDAVPRCDFNPDEVVALGAAVQSALLSEDRAVEDMVMTDVCPHTLGVEVCKEFGGHRTMGYFEPIIHRNTTIPVTKETFLSTIEANQFEVKLRIFQGEARKVTDNLLLGELNVQGIPPGPAGTEIAVRFTYDSSGILEVEAYVPATGKKFRTVLANHATNLSQAEIDAAVRKMQALKFYPRDDIENQRLLRYCERIVGEVSPFHRQSLESAIDTWEQAMSSGDREFFEHARTGLLMILSTLGVQFEDPASGDPE